MSAHKKPAPAAVKRHRPFALLLLADILAAALLVFGNYYFLYEAPIRGLSGTSLPLPQVHNNIQQSSHQQAAGAAGDAAGQAAAGLRAKFAAHFTDTVVSTDTTYSSPDLSVEVTQHTQGIGNDTVTYYVADIYMADLSSFRTEFAGGQYDANGQREHLDTMSRRAGAVLAMNGDSYCFNRSHCNGLLVLCVSAIALAVLTLLPEKQRPADHSAAAHHTRRRRR